MKTSELLREAAKILLDSEDNFFSWANHINGSGMALMSGLMFCPQEDLMRLRGWTDEEAALALCFAAAIAKSEGD